MTGPRDESVEAAIAEYLEAFNAGDYATVVSHYTEDVVQCPPIGGEIRGREALTEMYRGLMEELKPQISDYEYEYKVLGDHLILRESWTVTMNPPGEEPTSLPGRGMWVARWEEGGWKCFWLLGRLEPPPQS